MSAIKAVLKWFGILIGCVVVATVIGVSITKKEEWDKEQARIAAEVRSPPVHQPTTQKIKTVDSAESEQEMFKRAEQRGLELKRQRDQAGSQSTHELGHVCNTLGKFARKISELKQQGVSEDLAMGTVVSDNPVAVSMMKSTIKLVYGADLLPDHAETLSVTSCRMSAMKSK